MVYINNIKEDIMDIIYKHTSKTSGKSYIGKTSKTLNKRLNEHVKRANREANNTHFENALLKYGIDDFISEILEECEDSNNSNAREKYWIKYYDTFNNGYNMTKGGDGGATRNGIGLSGEDNPFYGKKHTDKTKKLISENQKGIVTCIDTRDGTKVRVKQDEFNSCDYYIGLTKGKIGVDSEETRFAKGKSRRGKKFGPAKKYPCIYCGKEMDKGNLSRYHNDNCKFKQTLSKN